MKGGRPVPVFVFYPHRSNFFFPLYLTRHPNALYAPQKKLTKDMFYE